MLKITDWEFAPFDLGVSLHRKEIRVEVVNFFESRGWVDATEECGISTVSLLLPSKVALFRKGWTLVYIPVSGFGVVRYRFDVPVEAGSSGSLTSSRALVNRVENHREICRVKDKPSIAMQDVYDLIRGLQSKLFKITKTAVRGDVRGDFLHPYSLTVFSFEGDLEDGSLFSLLNPRSLYCSPAQVESIPDPLEIQRKILELETSQLSSTGSVDGDITEEAKVENIDLWCGWSTVVFRESQAYVDMKILTACEFRVQSTWLAAHKVSKIADNFNGFGIGENSFRDLKLLKTVYNQAVSNHSQRLGVHSPSVPTRIVQKLIETSELEQEIERANASLASALDRGEIAAENATVKSRLLIEIFSLGFASAGLAQLLFPVPLTVSVVEDYPIQCCVWLLLTLIGIVAVIRQR